MFSYKIKHIISQNIDIMIDVSRRVLVLFSREIAVYVSMLKEPKHKCHTSKKKHGICFCLEKPIYKGKKKSQ